MTFHKHELNALEQMAEAVLKRDSLRLRSLVQDWVRSAEPAIKFAAPKHSRY